MPALHGLQHGWRRRKRTRRFCVSGGVHIGCKDGVHGILFWQLFGQASTATVSYFHIVEYCIFRDSFRLMHAWSIVVGKSSKKIWNFKAVADNSLMQPEVSVQSSRRQQKNSGMRFAEVLADKIGSGKTGTVLGLVTPLAAWRNPTCSEITCNSQVAHISKIIDASQCEFA